MFLLQKNEARISGRKRSLHRACQKNYGANSLCVNPFSVDDPRFRNGDKTMSFVFFWLCLKPNGGDYVINTDNKNVQQIVDKMRAVIDNAQNEYSDHAGSGEMP